MFEENVKEDEHYLNEEGLKKLMNLVTKLIPKIQLLNLHLKNCATEELEKAKNKVAKAEKENKTLK